MADVSDVLNALAAIAAQAIYPNGTGMPSVSGVATIAYPGWPQSSQLDADMTAIPQGTGRIHVTVYPGGPQRLTTRYFADWQPPVVNGATLVLTIAGQTVTVAGTVSVPQNVALVVDGAATVYAVQRADTLTSIATALAAQIQGASNVGAVITLPAGARIEAARAGGSGTIAREVRRQQGAVQVTVWADTPGHREATATAIDSALAALEFVTLPDGSSARLMYQSTRFDDTTQKANLYRRDLIYSAEYATVQTAVATQVVTFAGNVATTGPDGAAVPALTVTE